MEKKVNKHSEKTSKEGRNDQGKTKLSAFHGRIDRVIATHFFGLKDQIGYLYFLNAYKIIAYYQSLNIFMLQLDYAGSV